MLGHFYVAIDEKYDFRALDATMERFIVELTLRTGPRSSAAQALACRAAHWASAVQRQNKIPVSSYYHLRLEKAKQGSAETWFAALPVSAPRAAEAAMTWVAETLNSFLAQDCITLDAVAGAGERYERLKGSLKPFALASQNPIYIQQAALEMDIPIRQVANGIFSLGQGRNSRWLRSTISDQTSGLGVGLAHDKIATAAVLRQAGLPAPTHGKAATAEKAVQLARKLGFPVVVKPSDQEQGRGVNSDLRDDQAVAQAFADAAKYSSNIIVEKHFEGIGHRLTVSHGRVITATKKLPWGVTGDGNQTVEQLVEQAKLKPAKRELYAPVKPAPQLDEEAQGLLTQQGMTTKSVPARDQYVGLRRRNNASSGGTTIVLALDQVHPDNLDLAARAAHALRLDLAGVDLLIPDISKSWFESGALICEINAQPQMGQNPIYKVLADITGLNSRIPVHLAILLHQQAASKVVAAADMASRLGCNGFATREGVWLEGRRLTGPLENSFRAASILLNSRESNAALCVMSMDDVLNFGLPADYWDSIRILGSATRFVRPDAALKEMIKMIKGHTDRLLSARVSV
jgi:cyanophycin synthetase